MPILDDPRDTQNTIYGAVEPAFVAKPAPDEPTPGAVETLSAASRQSNVLGTLGSAIGGLAYDLVNMDEQSSPYTREGLLRPARSDPAAPDTPADWDALDHVDGYEDHARYLMDAQSPADLQRLKSRLDAKDADRQLLDRAGWRGTAAELVFAVVDPSFLVAAAVPETAVAKAYSLGRFGSAAVHGAAGAALYEGEMQLVQPDRPIGESLLNVGGGAVLSGTLGHLLHRIPANELKPIQEAIDIEFGPLAGSTTGAMARRAETTIGRETIARGGALMSKVISKTPFMNTALDVVMNSESIAARQHLQDLAQVTPMLSKNAEEGIATGSREFAGPAELAVTKHEARVADFIDFSKSALAEYKKRVPKADRLSDAQFYEAIAKSSRRGDNVGIKEADDAAKMLREKVFDPLWEDAKSLGLYEDPVAAAIAKAEGKAVDKYVGVQTRDLYAQYRARTRQAIGEAETTAGGETADIAARSANIKAQQELAIEQARRESEISMGQIESGVAKAEADYDAELQRLTREREINAQALKAQSDLLAETQGARNATAVDNLQEQLALSLSTERAVETATRNIAEAEYEVARRAYQKELARVSKEMDTAAKRREGRLRAKIELERASKKRAVALQEARTVAARNRGALKEKFGKDAIRSASKAARKTETTAQAYRYGVQSEQARAKLTKELVAASQARGAERTRLRTVVGKLNKQSIAELEKMSPVSRRQFIKRAKRILGAGDADPSAEVNQLAKLLREKEAGALKSRVQVPKVDERYLKRVIGAKSYFRRMYNRELIRGNQAEWKKTLTDWFGRSSDADIAEVEAAVNDVTAKILGSDVGMANFATKISVPTAGPLKERTLDIPDELIEGFLINDPVRVAQAYTRELAPRVELAKRFGDADLKQVFQNISDDYARLRSQAEATITDKKALNNRLKALRDQEKQVLDEIERVKRRILGTAGQRADTAKGTRSVNAMRNWRNLVVSTHLGGTAITGGTMDLARVTAQHGFAPTMAKMIKLATSKEFRELMRSQGRRVGAVIEVALAKRVQAQYDGAITEGWSDKLAHGVYRWTGLNHIMDFNRTLNAALFEDEVIKMSRRVTEGKDIGSFARGRLASLGLGTDELKAIASQVDRHGGDVDGVHVSGSADWDNKLLADKYDNAILAESRVTIQQPGAADRAWWMDSEMGKVLGQLKSFSLSAPSRLTTTGLQMAGQGNYARAARFFGYMMIGGYLTHAIRQTVAGKKPITDPGKAAYEAMVESGMAGLLPDLLEPPVRLFGRGEMGNVRQSDRSLFSAYGGPGVGAMGDAFSILPRVADGTVSSADLHAIRRLIPYNQLWFARKAIDALEGETAEALDLKGAEPASFTERLTGTR